MLTSTGPNMYMRKDSDPESPIAPHNDAEVSGQLVELRVNDLALKIGTVNGTGSSSANGLLLQGGLSRSSIDSVRLGRLPHKFNGVKNCRDCAFRLAKTMSRWAV